MSNPDNPDNPARRWWFKAAGAGSLAAAVPVRFVHAQSKLTTPAVPAARVFLNPREARFIEAAIARLIPRDELGPGALEAGVADFIDQQLGGAWGAGARLYRSGPWREGTASQGYQLPFTPAELFRKSLRDIDVEAFAAMAPAGQDEFLKGLEDKQKEFFEALLALTIEGFFGDPAYGGNRDMAGWRLIGFPGAYSNYYDLVDRPNYRFTAPPVSIGQGAHHAQGHGHPRPVKP